ncbi:hypothetical protein O181_008032 [Austropuccinia psidii MF-1]|uniref:Uncharacterized protein n=1 Tax=Austropuccinia psidii MF-1 TaxID=1389203 RepID=A0A9Q3BNY7_9BASI|nr:hypothetical protein [Austropuccinia psidii MF-1]
MNPHRSGSSYSIQSNRSGPGNSSDKLKRQECQPRGEAEMKDYKTSTSSKRPESFPTCNSEDIPVSVQELVYGSKVAGMGTSEKSSDMRNELLSSSEEVPGPIRYSRHYEGLDTHVLQRKSPQDKSLVENPKHFFRGP